MLFFTKDASLRKAAAMMACDEQLFADNMASVSEKEPFVNVTVRNPRTHISRETALYTDYEISIETNNIAFSCVTSCVRRRYSDFQWLRKRLITNYNWIVQSPPELPPKRLFGRFKRQFLKHRQRGLQRFIEDIIQENAYLSDVALHLFLQSSLPVEEIESHLNGKTSDGEIDEALESPGKKSGLSRSVTNIEEMPKECEANCEHDSGCCYSTTSSINDLMFTPSGKRMTRDEFRYYVSLPANLDKVSSVAGFVGDRHRRTLATASELSVNVERSLSSLHSDSGHIASEGCLLESDELTTSVDDQDIWHSSVDPAILADYDADDESYAEDANDLDDVNDCLLSECNDLFTPSDESNLLLQNMELLRSKPRLTDRLLCSDDESDECFHESEYDVIGSRDDLDQVDRVSKKSTLKARCHSYGGYQFREGVHDMTSLNDSPHVDEQNEVKVSSHQSKVRSLPNIRFPLKRRKRDLKTASSELLLSATNGCNDLRDLSSVENATMPTTAGECRVSCDKECNSDEESLLPRSDLDSSFYGMSDSQSALDRRPPILSRHHNGHRWSSSSSATHSRFQPGIYHCLSVPDPYATHGRFHVTTIAEMETSSFGVAEDFVRQDSDVFPSMPASAESIVGTSSSSYSHSDEPSPFDAELSPSCRWNGEDATPVIAEARLNFNVIPRYLCSAEKFLNAMAVHRAFARDVSAVATDEILYKVVPVECQPRRGLIIRQRAFGSVSNLLETYDDIANDPVLVQACDLNEYDILDTSL